MFLRPLYLRRVELGDGRIVWLTVDDPFCCYRPATIYYFFPFFSVFICRFPEFSTFARVTLCRHVSYDSCMTACSSFGINREAKMRYKKPAFFCPVSFFFFLVHLSKRPPRPLREWMAHLTQILSQHENKCAAFLSIGSHHQIISVRLAWS